MSDKEIIIVNPSEFGLEKTEATKIQEVFVPMLDKMTEMETEYNEVVKLEINPDTCKKARELRLRYVKVRTGTDEIHKKAKAYYLAGSRFVDAWRNAQKFSAIEKEGILDDIEKHYERIEEAKQEASNQERISLLAPYVADVSIYQLKDMSKQGFDELLKTSKFAFEAQKEAEAKAEKERLAKEKADKEEQERIRKENEKLKKEAEEAEALNAKQEKILDQEREEKERLEAELKAKEEAELKAEQDKIEKEAKEKEDKANTEKLAKYQEFLKKNGVTNTNKPLFYFETSETEVKLYKLVDTFRR